MAVERRISSASAVNLPRRILRLAGTETVISDCFRCPYMTGFNCGWTNEEVKWIVGGPIPQTCPLDKYREDDDDVA